MSHTSTMLEPCPGCGTFFAPFDGPTHRYIGASPACWALFSCVGIHERPPEAIVEGSRIPAGPTISIPAAPSSFDRLLGDAYAVQHHGGESPQAIQSVALHLLTLHGVLERDLALGNMMWVRERGLRIRGVYHKLAPPRLGAALTLRHLFPGGGVQTPIGRSDYVRSVYDAWITLHRETVAAWYDRYVLA